MKVDLYPSDIIKHQGGDVHQGTLTSFLILSSSPFTSLSFFEIVQAGGNLGIFRVFVYFLSPFSALDHSATAPLMYLRLNNAVKVFGRLNRVFSNFHGDVD